MEPANDAVSTIEIKDGKVREYVEYDPIEYKQDLLVRKAELEKELEHFNAEHDKLVARNEAELAEIEANLAILG